MLTIFFSSFIYFQFKPICANVFAKIQVFQKSASKMLAHEYETICNNIYLTTKLKHIDEVNKCFCKRSRNSSVGCEKNCINRLLNIECGDDCAFRSLCANKSFQKCQYQSIKVIPVMFKRFGLAADGNIPKDAFIIEYVGEVIDKTQLQSRQAEYLELEFSYLMQLDSMHVIDATKKGNISRFINHRCDPNACAEKWIVNGKQRIGIFSCQPIKQGEEITIDYGDDGMFEQCFCGALNCRGWNGVALKNED